MAAVWDTGTMWNTGPEGCSAPSITGFCFFLDFGESAWVNEAYLWEL